MPENFHTLRPSEKHKYFLDSDEVLQSLLFTQQIDKSYLLSLISLADFIKKHWEKPLFKSKLQALLSGYSCVLYFTQPSTRTFTSFSLAAQSLGMVTEEIRDPNISSLYKGESDIDSLLTMAYLSDLVVLRQGNASLIEEFALEINKRGLKTRLINGGSGADQHPTQSLLDVYTIISNLGIDKNTNDTYIVAMMGDLKHSRTVRSLSYILSMFNNVVQRFIAPAEYQIGHDILDHLDENSINYEIEYKGGHFRDIDCLYVVRIQDEYHTKKHDPSHFSNFRLPLSLMSSIKDSAIILHPLPRREEIPFSVDVFPQAKYWEAVERGKFIRIALILSMFDKEEEFWYKADTGDLFGP